MTARQWLIKEASKELNSKTRTDDPLHDAHMAIENVCSRIKYGKYTDDWGYSAGIVSKSQKALEYYLKIDIDGLAGTRLLNAVINKE